MRFPHLDKLRMFANVARHDSLVSAAESLNLTKGAVSHQIRLVEQELGFTLFSRHARGITLTAHGEDLLATLQPAFETIEQKVSQLRSEGLRTLTIGVTTYFASRWLSPRLMDFMRTHPDIRLRVQPMIDLLDLQGEGIDLSIRWGDGHWTDVVIERLFDCPAWPSGDAGAKAFVDELGIEKAFDELVLLSDRDDSTAWTHWYAAAGLHFRSRTDMLIIPDPNVRTQAVIDGQGVALNDDLVQAERDAGKLFRLSDIALSDYGYFLAYQPGAMSNPDIEAFANWLRASA
ncbi:MAG: LysR substrate-binding domain-containing protein [Hyphomicrobiales bacterium]